MSSIRTRLITGAAICGAAIGGGAIASAATSSTTSSSSSSTPAAQAPAGQPPPGGHTVNGKTETPLTGDVAAKVRAAAQAKVPGPSSGSRRTSTRAPPTRRTSSSLTARR